MTPPVVDPRAALRRLPMAKSAGLFARDGEHRPVVRVSPDLSTVEWVEVETLGEGMILRLDVLRGILQHWPKDRPLVVSGADDTLELATARGWNGPRYRLYSLNRLVSRWQTPGTVGTFSYRLPRLAGWFYCYIRREDHAVVSARYPHRPVTAGETYRAA